MRDQDKTKAQLIDELGQIRQQVIELEAVQAEYIRMEEVLRQSEQEKAAILDSMSEHVVFQNLEHRVLWANKAAGDSVNIAPHKLSGRYCYEIWQQSNKPCVDCPVAKAIETGEQQEAEMTTSDGRIWFIRACPLRDEKCIVIGAVEVTLEITERKRAEEALRESEEFSSSLLTNAPNPIIVINPDTSVRYVNHSLEQLTGFSSSEVIGTKAPYLWWTEETLEKTSRDLAEAMSRGAHKFEELFQRKNGERFWVEITPVPVVNEGQLKYYLSNWVDITERKRWEDALRESEEKFSKAFHSSPNPMVILVFPGGIIIDVNDSFVSATGYGHEEAMSRTTDELSLWVKPEERAEIRQMLLEWGQVRNKEVEFRMKSGEIRVGLYSADTIDIGGQLCLLTVIEDITERKRWEEALRASEGKYRALINDMNDGFMIVRGSKVLFANRSAAEAMGRTVEDVVGGTFLQDLAPVSMEKSKHIYERTKSGEPPPDYEEFELHIEDGVTVFVGVRFKETFYEGERAYSLLIRDITERKRAEEKIHAFQSRLRSLASRLSLAEERERKRLAADVHDQIGQELAVLQIKLGELREPLSSSSLQEQLDEIRELVDHTIQNTRSLTFELSPPILYELGLEPALEWLVEQVQPEHGIACRFEDDGQNKPLGDDSRGFVFWVVRELLMNVVRHARAQAATVSVCRDDGELQVVVEDDGVGFDTSEIERKTRGFGLFSIRQRLTEFGGQIEIESKLGHGTRVTLVTPLESGGGSTGGN